MKDTVVAYFCKASWPGRLPLSSAVSSLVKTLLANKSYPRSVKKLLRFFAVNLEPFTDQDFILDRTEELTIVIVAAEKDFPILNQCILNADKNLNYVATRKFIVIVPSSELQTAKALLTGLTIADVQDEDLLLNSDIRRKLKVKYPSRYGWALQQFLKLDYILNSGDTENYLLLDADTLLLQPRIWMDSNHRQLLFNSWERHAPYYHVLRDFGLLVPESALSFVTHHMYIRRSYLRQMFSDLGFTSIDELCARVIEVSIDNEGSPFSIDYELYGHYMSQRHSEVIRIAKWSNINLKLNRKQSLEDQIDKLKGGFGSVSFHDYL